MKTFEKIVLFVWRKETSDSRMDNFVEEVFFIEYSEQELEDSIKKYIRNKVGYKLISRNDI